MRATNVLQQLLDRLGTHSKAELQAICQCEGQPTKGTRDELIH